MRKGGIAAVALSLMALAAGVGACASGETHTYVWVDEVSATCWRTGTAGHYECGDTNCDKVFDENKKIVEKDSLVLPMTEHQYSWVEMVEATCSHVGLEAHYVCTNEDCGEVFDEQKNAVDIATLVRPLVDHEYYYTENTDGTHSKKCDGCGTETKGAHAYTREVVDEKYMRTAADCFSAAVYYKSCECGAFDSGKDAETFTNGTKLQHHFVDGVCEYCQTDLNGIKSAIAALPSVENMTVAAIIATKDAYAEYTKLDEELRIEVEGNEKLEALYAKASGIEYLDSTLWANDGVHGSAITITQGTDDRYGKYAEFNHTSGWAFFYLNAEGITTAKKVVFYVYNPSANDIKLTYGYVNETKTDNIFGGADRYHATLKAQTWTRVSFSYIMDYPIEHMRFVMGDQAGDSMNITGLKLTAWYLVNDITTITDLAYDKTLTYTYVAEQSAACETAGVAAHYTSGEKLYNVYKEEAMEDELIIPATDHSYGNDGVCTKCGASLQIIIDAIAALPEESALCFADIANVKSVYAQYAALSDTAKAAVSNGKKIETLYAKVKDITIISTELVHGGQNQAGLSFAKGTDTQYGEYVEITHTSDWANFKVNVAQAPTGKKVVLYVYSTKDMTLTFGTASTIYDSSNAANLHFTLKANEWTKIEIDWTYAYQIVNGMFVSGNAAGDYTNLTGLKFSAVYIVDDSSGVDALTPKSNT